MKTIILRMIASLLPILGVAFHQTQIKKLTTAHRRELNNETWDSWKNGYDAGIEEGIRRAERDALYRKSGLL